MNLSRLIHESTQHPNDKGYIRPSNCEIDQFFNQSFIPSWIIKDVTIIKSQVRIGFHWSTSYTQKVIFLPAYFLWERSIDVPLQFLENVWAYLYSYHKMTPRYSFVFTRLAESRQLSRISSTSTARITKTDLVHRTKTKYLIGNDENQCQRW